MARRKSRVRRNPRELPSWVVPVALLGVGGFLLFKFAKELKDFFGKAGEGYDKASNAVAKAIVGKSDMAVAKGITYLMPSGAIIPANQAKSAGGAFIEYAGLRYKIVEASPPGSGRYRVERV
jgi:hypothetical protein